MIVVMSRNGSQGRMKAKLNRTVMWLFILVLAAVAWRMVHLRTIYLEHEYRIPALWVHTDMHAFMQWSDTILAGDVLGRDTYHPQFDWMTKLAPMEQWYRWWGGREIFHQEPLYPYFLAGVRYLSNGSLVMPLFVQLLIGSIHPLVLYFLGRRLCDNRVGLIAAGMAVAYGPFIFYEGVLLRDWLPPVIEPLVLLSLIAAPGDSSLRSRWTKWCRWLLPGLLFGIALLARSFILLFLPAVLIWILLLRHENRGWRFQAASFFCVGLVIALSPLLVRNIVVGAPVFSLHNRTAEGFILGNAADGSPVGLEHPDSQYEILEAADGSLWGVVRHTLATHDSVAGFLYHQLTKFRGIFEPYDIPDNIAYANSRAHSPALQYSLSFWPLAAVGISGMVLSCWWRRREHVLVMVYFLSILAALMVVTANGRYRLSLVPVLMVYAAVLITWLWNWLLAKRWQAVAIAAGLTAALVVVQVTVVPIRALREDPLFPLSRGEYLAVNRLLGLHLMEQGRYYDALVKFNRTIQRVPEYDPGYYHRGRLMLTMGNAAAAEEDFTHAIELDPDFSAGFIGRGRARAKLGRYEQAIDDLSRAIGLNPSSAEAFHTRGLIERERGLNMQAINDFTRAIQIEPDNPDHYHARAIAWYHAGDPARADDDADTVIQLGGRIDPSLQQLLDNAAPWVRP